jgi:pSer/pThr/pTyr-binding forkhead associated (FHA) protein
MDILAEPVRSSRVALSGEVQDGVLLLEITIAGKKRVRPVEQEAILGRTDREHGTRPDIDFGADAAVSRRHARITRCGAGYLLRDLESLNGTVYNGDYLDPETDVLLEEGDEIDLGEFSHIRVLGVRGPAAPGRIEAPSAAERVPDEPSVYCAPPTDDPDELQARALVGDLMGLRFG